MNRAWTNPTVMTAALCIMLLTHTYIRVAGPVSALQLAVVGAYFWLVFPTFARNLVLSVGVTLGFSAIQYWLFQDKLHSTVFPERVYTYPLIFCILVLFIITIIGLLSARLIVQSVVRAFAGALLGVCAILAAASIVLQRQDLIATFYNNPNELAVVITAAFLYLAFSGSRARSVYLAAALAIFVIYVCGSRFSMLYVLALLTLYAFAGRGRSEERGKWQRIVIVGAVSLVVVMIGFLFIFDPMFYVGPLGALGVVPEAIWQGWDARTSVHTSLGYRINNVLVAIGTLMQTFGLGIGLGRSPGLTEVTSGLAGSIHVSPVEIVVELGIYACGLLAWINTRQASPAAIRTFAIWFGLGALGMSAQSSAYLTSYAAWFFILALCHYRLSAINDSEPIHTPATAGGFLR